VSEEDCHTVARKTDEYRCSSSFLCFIPDVPFIYNNSFAPGDGFAYFTTSIGRQRNSDALNSFMSDACKAYILAHFDRKNWHVGLATTPAFTIMRFANDDIHEAATVSLKHVAYPNQSISTTTTVFIPK
jgi:hypothetical protein